VLDFTPVGFIPTKLLLIEKQSVTFINFFIFQALEATKWFGSELIPPTVAAACSRPSANAPLKVVLACTCVGKDKVRSEMLQGNTRRGCMPLLKIVLVPPMGTIQGIVPSSLHGEHFI
jgi:hypothetical protein